MQEFSSVDLRAGGDTADYLVRPGWKAFILKTSGFAIVFCLLTFGAALLLILLVKDIDVTIGAGMLGVSILVLLLIVMHAKLYERTTSIYFDEDKVVHEIGILSHKKKKVPIHMVTDSSVRRTLFDRFLGVGDVNIGTSGTPGYEISVSCIPYTAAEQFHSGLYKRLAEIRKLGEPPREGA